MHVRRVFFFINFCHLSFSVDVGGTVVVGRVGWGSEDTETRWKEYSVEWLSLCGVDALFKSGSAFVPERLGTDG